MANFSDQTSEEMFDGYLFCSSSVSGSDNHESIALHCISMASLCIVLTITATIGNSLILVALHKETSLNPASKLLLRSLAITDLGVAVIGGSLTNAKFATVLLYRERKYFAVKMLNILYRANISQLLKIH